MFIKDVYSANKAMCRYSFRTRYKSICTSGHLSRSRNLLQSLSIGDRHLFIFEQLFLRNLSSVFDFIWSVTFAGGWEHTLSIPFLWPGSKAMKVRWAYFWSQSHFWTITIVKVKLTSKVSSSTFYDPIAWSTARHPTIIEWIY